MTNERATSCLRRTAMIVAAALVWGVTLSAPVVADPLSDFYDLPVESTGHSPGDVVRVRPMNSPKGFGLGFDIERILYTSTDTHGEPKTVSGYTMTPTAPWPGPGPRPVIAYAPGTSGMADRCAGSAVLGTVGAFPRHPAATAGRLSRRSDRLPGTRHSGRAHIPEPPGLGTCVARRSENRRR